MNKYLNYDLCVDGLPLLDINSMFHELFQRKDYEWWYQVQPDDVVVDLGACVGFFTCHALDRGAKKIYAVEPNRDHLRTLIRNTADYQIDHGETPVIPIHSSIGLQDRFNLGHYGGTQSAPRISFRDFIFKYQIHHIDFLKIDIEGGEFGIFTRENIQYLRHHVKHIAVEIHLDAFREAPYEWINMRDNILQNFNLKNVHFLKNEDHELAYNTEKLHGQWPIGWGSSFMLYITNS